MSTRKMVRVAVIAAIYAAVTIVLAPMSYGPIQVRVSEALTVLPFIMPESIVGLFLGCLIANLYGGLNALDIVFGSLATLAAAYLTRKMPTLFLAPLPPVLINAVVVGAVISYAVDIPLLPTMISVGTGQFAACYILGIPLLYFLKQYNWHRD